MKKEILDWITVVDLDLKSAEVLHRERLYAPAIFHLQQASEKLVKAYFLYLKFDKSMTKALGHLTIKEKDIEKMKNNPEFIEEFPIFKKIDVKRLSNSLAKSDKAAYSSGFMELVGAQINNDKETEPIILQLRDTYEKIWGKRGLNGSLMLTFAGLRMLAPLLSTHFDFVRYPDAEIKPQEYTENSGIVQAVPEILSLLKHAKNRLEDALAAGV